MGCCSSSSSVAVSKSPTCKDSIPNTLPSQANISIQQNTERINPIQLEQLQQYHNNQGQYDNDTQSSEDELPKSFANNKSIVNEVLRLQELDQDISDDKHSNNINIETKSNENSDDQLLISNNDQSFDEFTNHQTINVTADDSKPHMQQMNTSNNHDLEDSYHPFGIIQTRNEILKPLQMKESESVYTNEENVDLQQLYAESLKEHGFDADKFRVANASMTEECDRNERGHSTDMSSFASSQMSSHLSKSEIIHKTTNNTNTFMQNMGDFIAEQEAEEDLILEELSRADVFESVNDNTEDSYIQNFKESVKSSHKINNIMDDQDEELMDAILSLDLDSA